MPDLDRVLKHKNDIRYRVIGDEAVVVRQDAAEVLALNDVGARVLELLDSKTTIQGVIDRMSGEYDVERSELTRDVVGFVAAMHEAGIVEDVERDT